MTMVATSRDTVFAIFIIVVSAIQRPVSIPHVWRCEPSVYTGSFG